MSDDFKDEDFTEIPRKLVADNPLGEDEKRINLILASKPIDVRYYPEMTIQDALHQIKGNPQEGAKMRLLLDGQVSTLDTVIPNEGAEVIFVGEWVLGNQKKTIV